MSTIAETIPAYILSDLIRKLGSARFPHLPTTPGFILGTRFCLTEWRDGVCPNKCGQTSARPLL